MPNKTSMKCDDEREPVSPSARALGRQAEGPRFDSAWALLFLQKL